MPCCPISVSWLLTTAVTSTGRLVPRANGRGSGTGALCVVMTTGWRMPQATHLSPQTLSFSTFRGFPRSCFSSFDIFKTLRSLVGASPSLVLHLSPPPPPPPPPPHHPASILQSEARSPPLQSCPNGRVDGTRLTPPPARRGIADEDHARPSWKRPSFPSMVRNPCHDRLLLVAGRIH